jgi:hypothetical protein
MPLNKDVLGTLLYNARAAFDNKTMDELIAQHGTLEGVRLAICKADAEAIINHFKVDATVPALGLTAPNGAVTGTAKIV